MSDERSGIFASPESFDNYFTQAAERLRSRWESRVTFLRQAVERLEGLRRSAEALEEQETARELDEQLAGARAALAELEAAPVPGA